MFLLPGAKKQPTPKAKRKPAGDGVDAQLPLGGDLWKAGELSKDKSSAEPFDDDFVVGDEEREDEPAVDETESDDLEPSVDADESGDDGADADDWFDEPGLSDDADDEEEAAASTGTEDEEESDESEEEEDESVVAADPSEGSTDDQRAESESEESELDETEEEASDAVEKDEPVAAAAAPLPPPTTPAEPKATPRRRRKTPPPPPPPSALSQLMPWLGFAATIVVAFACATWFFLARPVLADRVLGSLPGFGDLQESVLLSRRIHLSAVEGAYQLIGDRETAFVISGYATSTAPLPVRDVKVRARLLGPDGGVIGEKNVYCGVATTPPVLSDLDSREVTVLQRIQPPPRFAIAPGEDAKFLAVFVDPPEGIAHYSLDVVSASALQR